MECGEKDVEMQEDLPDMSIQELEEKFRQRLDISNNLGEGTSHQNPGCPATLPTEVQKASLKYSISQHYTHTVSTFIGNAFLTCNKSWGGRICRNQRSWWDFDLGTF